MFVSNLAQFEDIIKSMKCTFTEWEGIARRYVMKLLDAFVKLLLRTPGLLDAFVKPLLYIKTPGLKLVLHG